MENKTQIKNVELPFFYGFYNSPLEDDYDIDEAINETVDYHNDELGENVEYDDFDFNAKEYRKEIVECFVEAINQYRPEWIQSIDNPELDSPMYYNYSTDKIYATVTLTDDWKQKLTEFFESHNEWLTKRIEEDWTSRSGFHSWIYTDMETFFTKLMEAEPQYLSIVMQYAIEINENCSEDTMFERMTGDTMEEFWGCHSTSEYVKKIEK